jgi:hypothetical protein
MNFADFVVGALGLCVLAAAVFRIVKNHQSGNSGGCSCGCSKCAGRANPSKGEG